VLSADGCKKHKKVDLEAPNPSRRRIYLIDPDGNESVGSEGNGTLRIHFRLVKQIESPDRAGKPTRRGPLLP
jgi:hypothetical protein